MNVSPRLTSELQRLTCVTCGVTFAVTKDYLYAQISNSRNILICPNGHTTPFSSRPMDSVGVTVDLRRRVQELEQALTHRRIPIPPLAEAPPEKVTVTYKTNKVPIQQPERREVTDGDDAWAAEEAVLVCNSVPVLGWPSHHPAARAAQEIDRKRHIPGVPPAQQLPERAGTTQCPVCQGWFRKPRQHVRDIHPALYTHGMFPKGTR